MVGLKFKQLSRREREFNRKGYGLLATYNSEVARGLIHTEDWKNRMAVIQARFNAELPPVGVLDETA
jgi:hypothetical protein